MATNNFINNIPIEQKTSDYSATAANAGRWWIRTDLANTIKIIASSPTWSAGGNLSQTKYYTQGAGTLNAGLCFGGTEAGGGQFSTTEEYDGSTWGAGGTLPVSINTHAGFGTQVAAVSCGGLNPAQVSSTYEYDGATWGNGGALASSRCHGAGAGILTAAFTTGGQYGATVFSTTEEYDGSTWSSGGNLSQSKYYLNGAAGTLTAGLLVGGSRGSDNAYVTQTEEYDGASWSAGGNILTTTSDGATFGTQTSGISAGGFYGTRYSNTYSYNGSAWSAITNLSSIKNANSGAGSGNTSGITTGGYSTENLSVTEELSLGYAVKTLTIS